jgi:phosphoribosylformimino-5-aminoimidazole carboxamide ribotide isomerase
MIVFPAIDLRGGQVVRLRQGDPRAQTVYAKSPAEAARRWAGQGAQWLHVVNLDGAFGGEDGAPESAQVNLRRLAEIHVATGLPIQFGGGVRSIDDIARSLDLGATRVVMGTVAVHRPQIIEDALARFSAEQIVVGIDAREGRVLVEGCQQASTATATDLAQQMAGLGVLRAVYTDVARDGMLAGANAAATAALARDSGLKVIASGGVASLADIRALAEHEPDGIEGLIIGQALYAGALGLADAIAAARG